MPDITSRKNLDALPALIAPEAGEDSLEFWCAAYFELAVTTAPSSRQVQQRDLGYFLAFMRQEIGHTRRDFWSPRLSRAFVDRLRMTLNGEGRRRFADPTINRILAHLKTFSKWVHQHRPFPLGDPLARLAALTVPSVLAVERALTSSEERRLLDAADRLIETGGRSRDRRAHAGKPVSERPRRQGYRPFRNRAIIYTLIGSGMRRAAVRNLDLADIDFDKALVTVLEKGGLRQRYHIRREALRAIRDYLKEEREEDNRHWGSPALFLTAPLVRSGDGRLSVRSLNAIWTAVARAAGVTGKTPHAARHAMGKRIMQKTGNLAAVQRQLGHRNAAFTLQYARPSVREMKAAIGDEESAGEE